MAGGGEGGDVGAVAAASDLGRGGHDAAAVRHLRPGFAPAEELHEDGAELVAEDAVDEDVDGRVDGDQQVRHLDQLVVHVAQLGKAESKVPLVASSDSLRPKA